MIQVTACLGTNREVNEEENGGGGGEAEQSRTKIKNCKTGLIKINILFFVSLSEHVEQRPVKEKHLCA